MILIKQAAIVDGSGKKPYRADILISDQKISAIGNFSNKKTETIIDAVGLTVTPGFVDVNTDSDHYLSLFIHPTQQDFLLQGVTTIIGGQCGASLAPLLYGSLQSLSRWTSTDLVNVDWHRLSEFVSVLNRLPIGVNFGTLVGHATIRHDVVGNDVRDLTQSELEIFTRVLKEALHDGGLGFSTGLGYAQESHVPYGELKQLVSVVARAKKIYATHLRDEQQHIVESVAETIQIAHETGVKTMINHLRPLRGFETKFQTAFELMEKNIANANIVVDVNPFPFSNVPIYSLLPMSLQNSDTEIMCGYLRNDQTRKEIHAALASVSLNDAVVTEARNQEALIGKTIRELAETQDKEPASVILDLMESTRLRARLLLQNVNGEMLRELLFHPRAFISSNSASMAEKKSGFTLQRSVATFPSFLELAKTKGLPLEEAVKKITYNPAQWFNLHRRGLVKEGYYADLVLLQDGTRISDVIVNGQVAVRNGAQTNMLAGTVL
ncbi:MAG TPA: amidohydrolase family protein [Candidatus Paceibacterota bacterium]